MIRTDGKATIAMKESDAYYYTEDGKTVPLKPFKFELLDKNGVPREEGSITIYAVNQEVAIELSKICEDAGELIKEK